MNYTEIINSTQIVLVEFYAVWCPHCVRMKPVVENIESALSGKITVCPVDIDKEPSLEEQEKIEIVPTFIIYRDGTEIWRGSGSMSEDALLSRLESAIRGDTPV